jgi:hypothetical protein
MSKVKTGNLTESKTPAKVKNALIVIQEKKFINPTALSWEWEYSLIDKETKEYKKGFIEQIKNNITISQQYEFIPKGETEKIFSVRYHFYKGNYNDLSKILEQNYNLFELIPSYCHIKPYFDLEIERDDITLKECKKLLLLFIDLIINEYKMIYDIVLKKSDFVILDSCKVGKLSYHLVIDSVYFENNKDQKIFINYLSAKFRDEESNIDSKVKLLLWSKVTKNGTDTRFIFDTIPYGNSQNFRLVNQTKVGKTNTLTIVNLTKKVKTIKDCFVRLFEGTNNRLKLDMEILINYAKKCEIEVDKVNTKIKKQSDKKVNHYTNINYNFFDINCVAISGKYLGEKMAIHELTNLPDWKRYLYLITVQGERNVWITI